MSERIFLIEHSSHYHCVNSWIKLTSGENNTIYISNFLTTTMGLYNEAYGVQVKIKSLNLVIIDILKSLVKNRKKPTLIIVTAPEHIMGIFEIFCVLTYILLKPSFLSIRDPDMWIKNEKNLLNLTRKQKSLIWISNFILQRLYFSAGQVVCESSCQEEFLRRYIPSKSKVKYFSGRLSDNNPKDYEFKERSVNNVVGLLGSVDIERRDYDLLFDALQEIPLKIRPKLAFLGVLKNNSLNVIERALEINVLEYYSEKFVSESTFFQIGQKCKLLISPLTIKKMYGPANGSGSFGDAITLRKSLLIPEHVPIPSEFEGFVTHYYNKKDLIKYFSISVESFKEMSPQNFSDFESFKIKRYLEC